jgi:hypothetical protein
MTIGGTVFIGDPKVTLVLMKPFPDSKYIGTGKFASGRKDAPTIAVCVPLKISVICTEPQSLAF